MREDVMYEHLTAKVFSALLQLFSQIGDDAGGIERYLQNARGLLQVEYSI